MDLSQLDAIVVGPAGLNGGKYQLNNGSCDVSFRVSNACSPIAFVAHPAPSVRSERVGLVQLGRFHLRADEFPCELQHRVLLAMDQEGDPRRGFPLPFEKFRLVGVAGKPVDGHGRFRHGHRRPDPSSPQA